MQFLWDKDATEGVKLGIPLVAVAGAVTFFSVSAVEPFVFLRRLGGVALLGATALFVVQLGRNIGWDNLSTDSIDAGPYLAGAGGLLALLAPTGLWPFNRRRSRPAQEQPATPALPSAPLPPPPPEEAPPVMPAGGNSDPEGEGRRYS